MTAKQIEPRWYPTSQNPCTTLLPSPYKYQLYPTLATKKYIRQWRKSTQKAMSGYQRLASTSRAELLRAWLAEFTPTQAKHQNTSNSRLSSRHNPATPYTTGFSFISLLAHPISLMPTFIWPQQQQSKGKVSTIRKMNVMAKAKDPTRNPPAIIPPSTKKIKTMMEQTVNFGKALVRKTSITRSPIDTPNMPTIVGVCLSRMKPKPRSEVEVSSCSISCIMWSFPAAMKYIPETRVASNTITKNTRQGRSVQERAQAGQMTLLEACGIQMMGDGGFGGSI